MEVEAVQVRLIWRVEPACTAARFVGAAGAVVSLTLSTVKLQVSVWFMLPEESLNQKYHWTVCPCVALMVLMTVTAEPFV